MRFLLGMFAAVAVVLLTVCVVAQEEITEEALQERLKKETSYTSEWLGGPRHIWHLEFKHEKITPIRVCIEEGEIEVYFYMLYTIKNVDEVDHEIEIRIGAWSDKQPCPNRWDETLKNYRRMKDLKYRDSFRPPKEIDKIEKDEDKRRDAKRKSDVVEKIEKKHFLKDANNGKGLFCLGDVTMPGELGKATQPGTHGDDKGINSPVIKAGETWQCVAVFKKISTEMDYFRIFVGGLTNDYKLLTHLDMEQVREYRGMDVVLMKNGEMIRCRSEERLNDLRMFVRNVAGLLDERMEKLQDVEEITKSKHTRIDPNQRLIVEKIYEITYERLGDEFYVSNDWVQKVEERWFEWIRVVDTDLPHKPVDIKNPPGGRGP